MGCDDGVADDQVRRGGVYMLLGAPREAADDFAAALAHGVGVPDGAPTVNLSALAATEAAVDGVSASVKLLDARLRAHATKPLAVWIVDAEFALRTAFLHAPHDPESESARRSPSSPMMLLLPSGLITKVFSKLFLQ